VSAESSRGSAYFHAGSWQQCPCGGWLCMSLLGPRMLSRILSCNASRWREAVRKWSWKLETD